MEKPAQSKNTPGTDAAFDLLGEIAIDPASDGRYPDGTVLIPADSPDASVLMSRAIERRRPIVRLGVWSHVVGNRSAEVTKQFIPTKFRKPRSVPTIDKLAVLLTDHFVLLDHPSEGLLFPSANNPEWPTDPGIVRRRTHARWKKAGLKPLGFHEGRHTFASIGIAAGLNAKTLSTYLGHATITITLDRYGHLMPGSEVEARVLPRRTYMYTRPRFPDRVIAKASMEV